MPPRSKAQARFLGAVAAGKIKRRRGPTRTQAREMLRGAKLKRLPARKRTGTSTKGGTRSVRAKRQPRTQTGKFRKR